MLEEEIFEKCSLINDFLNNHQDKEARNELIKLLDFHKQNKIEHYSHLVNHLIREVGLFPYMDIDSADWQDSFVYEMFKVDVGKDEKVTLHLQQSHLLKKLLEGKNIAVSAPTSFGKSFVIDAFISLKHPNNVVLIVPTIALMDETRRRLYKKFSKEYEIITTADVVPQEKNIFIFPQERALSYAEIISEIDILIIDEFYKASIDFEKERAVTLLKCISVFSPKAKQKYYLAPNISSLNTGPFTEDMEFLPLDFNTVFLETYNKYPEVLLNPIKKGDILNNILVHNPGKTLIYAGTYSEINNLKAFFLDKVVEKDVSGILSDFSKWLKINYDANWDLPKLVDRRVGVHNGRLHRSLAQIQVRLFDKPNCINYLISTSSIIEGVNTAAENVVVWKNRNGRPELNYFTYKNIVGRSGRMFQHFIGKIFLLDRVPQEAETQLSLNIPNDVAIDNTTFANINLQDSDKQILEKTSDELKESLGSDLYNLIKCDFGNFELKKNNLKDLVQRMYAQKWISGIGYLNSEDERTWIEPLKKLLFLQHSHWPIPYDKVATFITICASNWSKPLSEILQELSDVDINVDQFFDLEKTMSYNFANFLNIFNKLQKNIFEHPTDISPFISKISNAFLPPVVLQLEELGLPRMISQKINKNGYMDFSSPEMTTKSAITYFIKIGKENIKQIKDFDSFDKFIIDYFYEGIQN